MTKKIQTSGKNYSKISATTPGEFTMMINSINESNFAVLTSENFSLWLYYSEANPITIRFKILGSNDELTLKISDLNNITIDHSNWIQVKGAGGTELVENNFFEFVSNDLDYCIDFNVSGLSDDLGGGIAMVGTVSMIVPK